MTDGRTTKSAAELIAEHPHPFVHLRVHSQYSLLEGALPIGKVISHALKDKAPAIAISDTNNLFGALEFAQRASKDGVQPIIACQLSADFADHGEDAGRNQGRRHDSLPALVLIAATEEGHANLVRLVSLAYLGTDEGDPVHIRLDWLRQNSAGVICLTGGPEGPLGREIRDGHDALAETRLSILKQIYGDRLYVELQRCGNYDRHVEAATIDLAYRHQLPLVATNEAFFPTRDDYDAHDALIAIAEGAVIAEDNRRRLTPDHHLKSQAEMAELFADLPEAISNTMEIACRCSYFTQTRAPILPRFTGGDLNDTEAVIAAEAQELRRQAKEGLRARLDDLGMSPGFTDKDYAERQCRDTR